MLSMFFYKYAGGQNLFDGSVVFEGGRKMCFFSLNFKLGYRWKGKEVMV